MSPGLTPRRLYAVLGLALAVRAGVAALALPDPRRFFTPDAVQYIQIARDLDGAYLDAGSPSFAIGLLRTPLYPIFAAAMLRLGADSVEAVIAAQIALGAATAALACVLASRLFGASAGLLAALVVAVDPASVVYCCLLQPEALFTLLVVAAAIAWLSALGGSSSRAALAGLLLGLCALTRPIALFLPLLIAITPWLRREWAPARRPAVIACLLLPALALSGGWIVRNALVAGAPVLSAIEGTNLLYYRAAGALAEESGAPIEDVRRELAEDMQARVPPNATAAERSRAESTRALEILASHPLAALGSAARGIARLLAGTGATALSGLRGDPEPERVLGAAEQALSAVLGALLAALYLAAGLAALGLWRAGARAELVFLAIFIAYFVLISAGPEANTRFRVPIAPFLAALAGAGLASRVRKPARM